MDNPCRCKPEVRQLFSCKIWNYFVGTSKIIQLLNTLAHAISKVKQVPALPSLQVELLLWGSAFCTALLLHPLGSWVFPTTPGHWSCCSQTSTFSWLLETQILKGNVQSLLAIR